MGTKFQIIKEGKVITRVKSEWPKYKRKEGYYLYMWSAKGKGWAKIAMSTYRSKK